MSEPTRREIMHLMAGLGVGSVTFRRAVASQAEGKKSRELTAEMVQQAEWVAGLELNDRQRREVLFRLRRQLAGFEAARGVELANAVAPATAFNPAPWLPPADTEVDRSWPAPAAVPAKPDADDDIAFMPVTSLAGLLRSRKISSVELTKLYLARLKKYDPALKCVVNLTEEIALEQAKRADAEIAAGRYRGPLHGVPWGAKDLISYPGTKTTWGALPYKDQEIDTKATVAARLEAAGAVLAAKLTLGALAMGDKWFGGTTRNPWNVKQGSSGSSAGSASASVAGLVGFAIGTETLGSIVSPCRRCGATGLRPTFGRVSRAGCMALAWTMDKVGPIARSVEDCAAVFNAIHGRDGLDNTAVDRPFDWPPSRDLRQLRVGYFQTREEAKGRDDLRVLRDLGVTLVPLKFEPKVPVGPLLTILNAEASAAFDDLTREGVTEGLNSWPLTFRQGEFIPAVEYIRANRLRSKLMQDMRELMRGVDCYVGGNDLFVTNLTGHPTVVMPNGYSERRGAVRPLSVTFTGRLYGEAELLAVANAYQKATGHHLKRPPLEKALAE